jgi:hypothetical protein
MQQQARQIKTGSVLTNRTFYQRSSSRSVDIFQEAACECSAYRTARSFLAQAQRHIRAIVNLAPLGAVTLPVVV